MAASRGTDRSPSRRRSAIANLLRVAHSDLDDADTLLERGKRRNAAFLAGQALAHVIGALAASEHGWPLEDWKAGLSIVPKADPIRPELVRIHVLIGRDIGPAVRTDGQLAPEPDASQLGQAFAQAAVVLEAVAKAFDVDLAGTGPAGRVAPIRPEPFLKKPKPKPLVPPAVRQDPEVPRTFRRSRAIGAAHSETWASAKAATCCGRRKAHARNRASDGPVQACHHPWSTARTVAHVRPEAGGQNRGAPAGAPAGFQPSRRRRPGSARHRSARHSPAFQYGTPASRACARGLPCARNIIDGVLVSDGQVESDGSGGPGSHWTSGRSDQERNPTTVQDDRPGGRTVQLPPGDRDSLADAGK